MSIELITGPMFSSKSSTLISRIDRYKISKKKVLVIKWSGDNRYTKDPTMVTHDNRKVPCLLWDDDDMERSLMNYSNSLSRYDVICIDEGSFFKGIVHFCDTLANKSHIVIVSSLVGTYKREGFNDILNLIPKCDKITMLNAVCTYCLCDGASFTKRITDEDATELVGGADHYVAVCRTCLFKTP